MDDCLLKVLDCMVINLLDAIYTFEPIWSSHVSTLAAPPIFGFFLASQHYYLLRHIMLLTYLVLLDRRDREIWLWLHSCERRLKLNLGLTHAVRGASAVSGANSFGHAGCIFAGSSDIEDIFRLFFVDLGPLHRLILCDYSALSWQLVRARCDHLTLHLKIVGAWGYEVLFKSF